MRVQVSKLVGANLLRVMGEVEGVRDAERGTRHEPFNSTPMGVNPISPGSPHVRPVGVHRTCGEPDEIKKNTHPKYFTALFREQARGPQRPSSTARSSTRA